MAGKPRVHEIAKELNVTSKEVLAKLREQGEFVKSASSTLEVPVVRRLKEAFPDGGGASDSGEKKSSGASAKPGTKQSGANSGSGSAAAKPGAKPGPAKSAGAKPAAPAAPVAKAPAGDAPRPGASRPAPKAPQAESKPAAPQSPASAPKPGAAAPKPGGQAASATPASPAARPGAKPGPRPGPKAPRVANNPFSTNQPSRPAPRPAPGPGGPRPGQGGPRPGGAGRPGQGGPRPGGAGGPRPQGGGRPGGAGAPRPGGQGGQGGPRPNPAMMPAHPSPGAMPEKVKPGGRGRPGGGNRPGGGGGFRGGPGGGPGGRPGGGGRGRGGAAGAFGRPGGAPRKGRKSKRQKRQEYDSMRAPEVGGVRLPNGNGQTVRLAQGASLADFADKIDVNPAQLVQALFNLGEMATATQSVSEETLQLLGEEMGFKIQVVSPEDEDRELLETFDLSFGEDEGGDDDLAKRPPVVTVMGHVDHGKTRLLDTIRRENVGADEAGGITQHIGAYQVQAEVEGSERTITFIDTPGHEAFTAMRARGAKSTDIAVIVVAADDGVMPQTVEAINHAQAAEVPIVVAVNKIDKEGADPAKIRGQMTEYGLVPEEYGGDTMFVDISAREGTNIDQLLSAVVLTADAALELYANPDMDAQGVAIEAHLDRGRGPMATVIIQRGTLRVGDSIVVGDAYGRVRRMLDEHGDDVEEAGPSRPVQVIGLTSVSGAGDALMVVDEDRIARQIADKRNARKRNALAARRQKRISLEDLDQVLKETSQLNLIIKGDNAGTVEALEESLLGIEIDDEVELRVVDRGVGAVTETNVNLAAASDAIIIGFNVRAEGKATELANREGVEIRYYSVIYQAIDEIESALKGMLKPIYEESTLGSAEIRQLFKSSAVGTIAGCMVSSGRVRRHAKARLIRDGNVVAETMEIKTLRREKDDVTEVREGFECGMTLSYPDLQIGDIVEAYELVEKPRD